MNQAAKDTIKRMNELGNQRVPFVFILDFDLVEPKIFKLDELSDQGILVDIADLQNANKLSIEKRDFYFRKSPVSFHHYKKAFDMVMQHILHGDSFLLNLTMPTKIETNLDLKEIFLRSKAKYKLLYKDDFVVFSPEPFIKIVGDEIFSYPMKGTINAGIDNAVSLLLNDPKEISEHNTIVDLIRNDLSMVSERVRVKNFRYFEEIQTHEKVLLQTSSEISGHLINDWNSRIGEIVFKLLPAGSISGAPKKKTIEVIKEAEKYNRGYFTGIFGYFSGKELHSAVMIRYIEKQGDQLIFKSGGGITNHSKAETEYQELIDKVYVPVI